MTLEEFKISLTQETPPGGSSDVLQALWQDGKGHWDTAHRLAQSVNNAQGAWVHAYLHRKEGDLGNAAYWYAHAGKTMPLLSLTEEWEYLVSQFLQP
ncbi:MAG: hypothetical protein BWK79_06025 [Beggiatoa sp. IS2]|nr:MAG: hypothetical protein BWK79_06025 [Beggiatoa sp. IS2]